MKKRICCIGGGHGLGRILSALDCDQWLLTGIVATTDNGGSTGRLREYNNTIAWGDLRNCLSQLGQKNNTASLLFEYRFNNVGELSGHSLGNLMLLALNQLCVRPTDCISVVKDFLNISPNLYPMSDVPTTLMAKTASGSTVEGEVCIDATESLTQLWLNPMVPAEDEVINDIKSSDLIILGPGSFFTSILPALLVDNIASTINQSNADVVLVGNISAETSRASMGIGLGSQLKILKQHGIEKEIKVLWPDHRKSELNNTSNIVLHSFKKDPAGLHNKQDLFYAIQKMIF